MLILKLQIDIMLSNNNQQKASIGGPFGIVQGKTHNKSIQNQFEELDLNIFKQQKQVVSVIVQRKEFNEGIIQRKIQWENLDQPQQRQIRQQVERANFQLQAKQHLKYDEHNKIKQNKKLNSIQTNIRNDQVATIDAVNKSELSRSGLSSESSSIHSNLRSSFNQLIRNEKDQQELNNKRDKEKKGGQQDLQVIRKDLIHNSQDRSYKYLFYKDSNTPKKQQIQPQMKAPTESKKLKDRRHKKIQQQDQLQQRYKYEKDKHRHSQTAIGRLKNKMGFIIQHFLESNEVASVSYYSSQSLASRSVQIKVIQQPSKQLNKEQAKERERERVIFSMEQFHGQVHQLEQMREPNQKQTENVLQREQVKDQQENLQQQLNQTPKKTMDLERSFISKDSQLSQMLAKSISKSKHSRHSRSGSKFKRRNSLENLQNVNFEIQKQQQKVKQCVKSQSNKSRRIQLEQFDPKVQLKEKLEANKSIGSFHSDGIEVYEPIGIVHPNNIDYNFKQPSDKQDINQPVQILKETVQLQVKYNKIEQNGKQQLNQIKLQQITVKSGQNIANRQKYEKFQQLTVKKAQTNELVEIRYKKIDKSQKDVNIAPKSQDKLKPLKQLKGQTSHREEQFVQDEKISGQLKQLETKLPLKHYKHNYMQTVEHQREQEIETIDFTPKNKVQFKIEARQRLKTDLNEKPQQNRKILTLLKKREEALAKKMKEQRQINPKAFLFPESSSGVSHRSSVLSSQKQQITSQTKLMMNTMGANSFRSKTSSQGSVLPSIKANENKEVVQQFKTLYVDSEKQKKVIPKIVSTNLLLDQIKSYRVSNSSQKDGFIEGEKLQRIKNETLEPAVNKIAYINLNKLHSEQRKLHFTDKNINAKEKYDRLKQLLEEI